MWANRTFLEGDQARRSGRLYAGVAGKAALVFDSCLDVLRRGDQDIKTIAAMLRVAGLTWPHVSPDMDILGALAFMDETLNWAVLFDFERVPRHETPCRRTSSSKSRKLSSTGGGDDYVVRVKVARHFLPLQRLVADMVAHDRFDAYLELLFVTLVNQDLKPVPSANRTKSIEIDVVPYLAAAARTTTSKSLCTTTEGVKLLTPWLSSFAWHDSLVRLLRLNGSSAVHVEITCPELFRTFFGSKVRRA